MKQVTGSSAIYHKHVAKTVILLVAAMVLCGLAAGFALASDDGTADGAPGHELYLVCGTAYWTDYANGLLSVDYAIGNRGTGVAEGVRITEATASGGVTLVTPLPVSIGTLAPGDEVGFTLTWKLPSSDVTSFSTHITACAGCPRPCTPGSLDIKPYSCPNSINTKSEGTIPVGVISSPRFDATTLLRESIMFAGAPALDIGASPQDINGDGLMDMVFHFATAKTNLQAGDSMACLSGLTKDGVAYRDCDSVRVKK